MKSWKEHPHLFHGFEVQTERKQRLSIIGATLDKKSLVVQTSESIHKYAIDDCTLIARRIESLTREELREILKVDGFRDDDILRAIEEGRTDIVLEFIRSSLEGALELLARGVYPFDQSHFDLPNDDHEAKVIDIEDLDQ